MNVLAWLAQLGTEELVVFATDEETASELALAELGQHPQILRREQRFDLYSPGPMKAKIAVMEYGLCLVCPCCGAGVWKEKAQLEKKALVFKQELAFCNRECHVTWLQRMTDNDDQIEEAKEVILGHCPDAFIERWWTKEDRLGVLEVFMQFRIPGGIDFAQWRSGDPRLIKLSKADTATWYDYKRSRRVH